jgi:hypothetical protein
MMASLKQHAVRDNVTSELKMALPADLARREMPSINDSPEIAAWKKRPATS